MANTMQVQLTEKFPNILIKDKRIFRTNIEVSPTSAQFTKQRNNLESEDDAVEFLRDQIIGGEYLGQCNVIKYNRIGHLVRTSASSYAVLSLTNYSVFYVSSYLTDFSLIGTGEPEFIEVEGVEVDVSKIEMSQHYLNNLSERLKMPVEAAQALYTDILVNGTYICVTHDKEEHKPAHLYAKDGRLIYLSIDLQKIVTVYSNGFSSGFIHPGVNGKIVDTLFSEIAKLKKKEKELEKRNTLAQLTTNLRVAQLELDIYRSRKGTKKESLELELAEARQTMVPLEEEWEAVVDEIRQTAIALAAFV